MALANGHPGNTPPIDRDETVQILVEVKLVATMTLRMMLRLIMMVVMKKKVKMMMTKKGSRVTHH